MEEQRNLPERAAGGERPAEQNRTSIEACSAEQAIELSSKSNLLLATTRSGGVMNTFTNYCEIVENDLYLKGKFSYNTLSGRVMVEGVYWNAKPHPLRDSDISEIRYFMSSQYGIDQEKSVMKAVEMIAEHNKYSPIVQMLEALPAWDGTYRIENLLPRYLGAERSEYTTEVTKIMLHGAIQRAMSPGVKYDVCVILADPMQGTGKSTLCNMLALDDEYFTDGVNSFSKQKDTFEVIRGRWIVELGEMMATRNTKDIETIKRYLSAKMDSYRTPYDKYSEQIPRQCIFIGTTNRTQFLPDDKSGNRRFLPILCDGRRAEHHPLEDPTETREYIKQCYAEAMLLGDLEGWTLELNSRFNDVVDAIREESTPEDIYVGLIERYLDGLDKSNKYVCSKMIWDHVYDVNGNKGTAPKYELQDISETMNKKIKGWKRTVSASGKPVKRKFEAYGMQLAWERDDTQPIPTPMEIIPDDEEIPFD